MMVRADRFLLFSSIVMLAKAQLSGHVGPTTSLAAKSKVKECNVLNYGAKADNSTDIGPAITAAVNACSGGGVVIIPQGLYAMKTFVSIDGISGLAVQLDGIIERAAAGQGNMISISNCNDFEMLSSTGKGAIQGNGYIYHINGSLTGPRILRTTNVKNYSVHDLALVDSPAFHFVMDSCTNGEVYNMAIRGGNSGGLDGIDVWGNNIFVHDVMVTNKDECVTVKSPASNILVENIYCNWSGGSAIGSLATGTDIQNVLYQRVYTWMSNQMMLIKSKDGNGTVRNVVFENFIGHGNAYSLDIDQYWSPEAAGPGAGVQLENITFSNWHGTEANGVQRGPIRIECADAVPCTDINIKNFAMWTEEGDEQYYICRSAYGSGFCLAPGDGGGYAAVTSTVTSAPSGYAAPTMSDDLQSAFGTTQSIPIPTHPASYFPGTPPISAAP